MKRLTFKPEHEQPVKDGTKRFTSRWRDQKLKVGEIVAAVTGRPGTPAFLTPASKAFAMVRIASVEEKLWGDFTEEDAGRCGVTRAWYLRERPDAKDTDRIWTYGLEVMPEGGL